MMQNNDEFWDALDQLVAGTEIVIDRPKGSAHPRHPGFIYRVDYGYLKDTSSMDGGGIDLQIAAGWNRTTRDNIVDAKNDMDVGVDVDSVGGELVGGLPVGLRGKRQGDLGSGERFLQTCHKAAAAILRVA